MGLDNGIVLKRKWSEIEAEIPSFLARTVSEYDKFKIKRIDNGDGTFAEEKIELNTFEVCYWRKYWGVRDEILHILDPKKLQTDAIHFNLEVAEMRAIAKNLLTWMNSFKFIENEATTIWSYDEAIDSMIYNYMWLEWAIDYAEKHPDAEFYFYDSY